MKGLAVGAALLSAVAIGLILLSALPASARPSPAATQEAPRTIFCPRCGYQADSGWRYCPSCGWDLKTLVGEDARKRLEAVGHSVLGLTVAKSKEAVAPGLFALLSRYAFVVPGMQKTMGTAIPFLRPGLFITTARILENGEYADLRTYNNRTYKGEILGYDLASGVGVIHADVPGIQPLDPAGDSPAVSTSAWVVCFPVEVSDGLIHYLPQSIHRGRLTAAGQTGTGLVSFENLLRSDHTIPFGCAGGPMVDLFGGAAGMVLSSPDPGLTYSTPLAGLAPVVEALAAKAEPRRPYFGFSLVVPDERRKSRFGMTGTPDHPLIAYLIPGSPAEKAGIQPGDLLMAVGGRKAATVVEAGGLLLGAAPGGPPVSLTVSRGGKEVEIPVTPAQRPRRILLSPADEFQEGLEANLKEVTTGATSRQGLQVTDLVPGGRGENSHFKNGDLIIEVDGRPVRRLDGFNEIVRSENREIFGGKKTEASSAYFSYSLSLQVRAEGEDKQSRNYVNLFPDILEPPVY